MAILIKIHQKFIKDCIYYYEVDDCSNSDEGHFYIGVDSGKKIVYFYKLDDLENYIDYFNFSISDKLHAIPGLNKSAVTWAAFTAYEALRKNVFTESMSRQS